MRRRVVSSSGGKLTVEDDALDDGLREKKLVKKRKPAPTGLISRFIHRILTPEWDEGSNNPAGYEPDQGVMPFFVLAHLFAGLIFTTFGGIYLYSDWIFPRYGYLDYSGWSPETSVYACGAVPCYMQTGA
jgi:hypothetical protein